MHQIVTRWCKRWCKQTVRPIIGARGSNRIRLLFGRGTKRKLRKQLHRPRHVQESRIGVHIHGQVDGTVTHRFLSRSRGHSNAAQHRTERMPKSMNIHLPTPFVNLRDSSRLKIPIENPEKLFR